MGWAIGRASSLYKSGCWFVGGDNLTGALHVLLAPHPLSLDPVKSRMKTVWYRLRMRDGERRSVSCHAVIFCPLDTLNYAGNCNYSNAAGATFKGFCRKTSGDMACLHGKNWLVRQILTELRKQKYC